MLGNEPPALLPSLYKVEAQPQGRFPSHSSLCPMPGRFVGGAMWKYAYDGGLTLEVCTSAARVLRTKQQ